MMDEKDEKRLPVDDFASKSLVSDDFSLSSTGPVIGDESLKFYQLVCYILL